MELTKRQMDFLAKKRDEANKKVMELWAALDELDARRQAVLAELSKWRTVECNATNMRNGIIKYDKELLEIT
jgi:uncharacterized coiled-coil DUF342 family protein